MSSRAISFSAIIATLLISFPLYAQPSFRPSREYRSILTEAYKISIQRNGRVDVSLVTGQPIFENAFPMVWLEGEDEAERLPVDGRLSARMSVTDPLGEGKGMVLKEDECEWHLRAYPSRRFFAVQVAYVNESDEPVRVKALLPWCIGEPKDGQVVVGRSEDPIAILENTPGHAPRVVRDKARSDTSLALVNRATAKTLVAGYVTYNRAVTRLTVDRLVDGAFGQFRAQCFYDPPKVVEPGERLESEVLYLAVGELNPFDGLERFARARAVVNGVSREKALYPHTWSTWDSAAKGEISEGQLLQELETIEEQLKRYGWNHFRVDRGWQEAMGDWRPDSNRFPNGLEAITRAAHDREMTAELWFAPFLVSRDSTLAREHPNWLLEIEPSEGQLLPDGTAVLDVSRPEAINHLRDAAVQAGATWNFDALYVDFADALLMADGYAHLDGRTHLELTHQAMDILWDAFGREKAFTVAASPSMLSLEADALATSRQSAPIWDSLAMSAHWGAVQSLNAAANRYYLSPHLWTPSLNTIYFPDERIRARWHTDARPDLTSDQSLAWLTGAAMLGGTINLGTLPSELESQHVDILRRMLPTASRPARPVDLFSSDEPRIWWLPIESPIGNWQVVALFNWDEDNTAQFTLPFPLFGMVPGKLYTVYDFWNDTYYGKARDSLDVTAAPSSVRLLAFKPYEDRPMFLSTDSHFTQGAKDFTALTWDEANRALHGSFHGIADTEYVLKVLAPEPYEAKEVTVSSGPVSHTTDGELIRLRFRCERTGPVDWTVEF